jgi:hypothetical protein
VTKTERNIILAMADQWTEADPNHSRRVRFVWKASRRTSGANIIETFEVVE